MRKVLKTTLILIIFIGVLLFTNQVYAASARIRAGSTNIRPGQETTITVSVSNTEAWNLSISASGGSLTGNTVAVDAAGGEVDRTVITATFRADSPGTYTISVSGQVMGAD